VSGIAKWLGLILRSIFGTQVTKSKIYATILSGVAKWLGLIPVLVNLWQKLLHPRLRLEL
jgi:hypothetical protein